MKIDKDFFIQKILPILITAILSALISTLQNILAQYIGNPKIHSDPVVAGSIGIAIKAFHQNIVC